MNAKQLLFAVTIALGLSTSTTLAVPVQVTHQDDPLCCDFLFVPADVDELGVVSFPVDELILATDIPTPVIACPSHGIGVASTQVSITNLTNRSFSELWYVADPETTITNRDGFVNGQSAFKIDAAGINQSLVLESINANGIFEPGEVWDFIIDSYSNTLNLPASALHSIGLVGIFSGGDSMSSGSIIAMPVPEPAGLALLLSSGVVAVVRRGRKGV
jgi:hypothetical protein